MEKKSCTDVNQGKQLSAFLPLESADCFWDYDSMQKFHRINWFEDGYNKHSQLMLNENNVCAWSLSALLDVLPVLKRSGYEKAKPNIRFNVFTNKWVCDSLYYTSDGYDNPIDAVFEMIVKLHAQNLL